MRKKRKLETAEERNSRLESVAQERRDAGGQEGNKLDAMVRRSITFFGA